MGFFDLGAPLFDALDGLMGALGHGWRLAVWSLIGSVLSMGLYKLFSRQEAMAELKPQIAAAQRALANFDGEINEMWPLMRRQLGLSLRQLGMALGPALLASVPLIFLLVWLSNRFDTLPPQPGDEIAVTVSGGELVSPALSTLSDDSLQLTWPGAELELSDGDGRELAALSAEQITPVLHKRQWWNALIANPAGYLPDETTIELITFELDSREFLSIGPGWLRGWEATFLGLLLVFSLILKFWWKLH